MKSVILHTDGACSGNPGPGGYAAILRYGERERAVCGYACETTNNRMELTAVIAGLQALRQPCEVEIVTDSKYVADGFTQWLPGWAKKGFRKVKNADLWQALLEAAQPHQVRFTWVRGHAGHPDNERADRLACEQRDAASKEKAATMFAG
ncbi:Ribonuclease H (plasmid) [Deinococcus proteolyticus MRP]|uniref:Ribonuclease H n=1 Tax=Deinococcus proteolyticus (strain ATCC 35074 / DSM 20540 / JCM 6276 / NBRC 101906 / NCIMB 13154 / VKM Ac-1939 / CCM 2703 / MRP) TaxID=693977 RepID=F0RQ93_DEIPM|nr:ribonuclease HI [Deinococcus proteolyticus]ADY27452.1 Ribonuclease H [Deinococcus proteolyticus MRP]